MAISAGAFSVLAIGAYFIGGIWDKRFYRKLAKVERAKLQENIPTWLENSRETLMRNGQSMQKGIVEYVGSSRDFAGRSIENQTKDSLRVFDSSEFAFGDEEKESRSWGGGSGAAGMSITVYDDRAEADVAKRFVSVASLVECLPEIFQAKSFYDFYVNELVSRHRWLSVLFYFDKNVSRALRVYNLATCIAFTALVQVVYYLIILQTFQFPNY